MALEGRLEPPSVSGKHSLHVESLPYSFEALARPATANTAKDLIARVWVVV